MANDGGEEDARKVEAFRGALRCFVGTHPFHNYTKKRFVGTLSAWCLKPARNVKPAPI
jgi:hypothetical protein